MIKIDFNSLRKALIGAKVDKPTGGTLSGHAAGEPFDKYVYAELQKIYGKEKVFRQYEYLNSLYQKNPKAITLSEKKKLWESPTALFLLSRGESAIKKWNEDNLFEEKQDDTADILISEKNDYQLIDVKTRNMSIEKSRIFVNNVTKNEIQNVLSGKSQVSYGIAIKAAASYLRGNAGANFEAKSSEDRSIKPQEEAKLRKYITDNSLWVNESMKQMY